MSHEFEMCQGQNIIREPVMNGKQISVWGSSFVERRIRRRNALRIGCQFSSVREDHIAQMEFSYWDDRLNFFRHTVYV